MKVEFSIEMFEKFSNIKFHGKLSIGSPVVPCGQRGRKTDMTNLIVDFRNFANAPKKRYITQNVHGEESLLQSSPLVIYFTHLCYSARQNKIMENCKTVIELPGRMLRKLLFYTGIYYIHTKWKITHTHTHTHRYIYIHIQAHAHKVQYIHAHTHIRCAPWLHIMNTTKVWQIYISSKELLSLGIPEARQKTFTIRPCIIHEVKDIR
jgi:hypothetical protein